MTIFGSTDSWSDCYGFDPAKEERLEEINGVNPREDEKKLNRSGITVYGQPICIACDRETISLGPERYPCRCPICGTRWHTVLSKEQDLLCRSNVEVSRA